MSEVLNMIPKALNRANVGDFAFLVPPDTVLDMQRDDSISGFAVYSDDRYIGALCGSFVSDAQFMIRSLYVVPSKRRMGVGSFMIETLLDLLAFYNVEIRAEVAKLGTEDDAVCSFLEKQGFSEYYSESNRVYSTNLVEVQKLKIPKGDGSFTVKAFSGITEREFESFKPQDPDDFIPTPYGGFKGEHVDPDSSIGLFEGEKLVGYAVIEAYNESTIILNSLYVAENLNNTAFTILIKNLISRVTERYDMDTKLLIPVVNEKLDRVVTRIFPPKALNEGSVLYKMNINYEQDNYLDVSVSDFLEEQGEVFDQFMYS